MNRVVLDGAVDVVADQAPAFVLLAIAAAVVAVGAESGDLDDLAPEHHVGQAETPADQAAVAEQGLDLFRGGVGGHVEILRMAADQQVAHRAPDEIAGEAGIAQPVQDAQCIGTDVPAREGVLVARDDAQGDGGWGGLGRNGGGPYGRRRSEQYPGGLQARFARDRHLPQVPAGEYTSPSRRRLPKAPFV